MFGVAVNTAIASNSLVSLFALHHETVSWLVFFIPMILICAGINYIGIKPSVRAQLTLELASMAALAVIMAFVLGKGGAHGLSLSPFNPHYSTKGWGGIGYGMIFGFSGFAGFEAAAALGRETRNPTKSIPRSIMFSLIGAGLFFIFITYALSVGYGVKNGATWAADATPLNTIANKYAGSAWAQTVDVLVAISGFSGAMGIVTLSSRIFYDMGRGGVGVPWLVKLHPRFSAPTRLVIMICSVALVTGVLVGETTTPATVVGFIGSTTTLGLILVYFSIALAGLRNFNTLSPDGPEPDVPGRLYRAADRRDGPARLRLLFLGHPRPGLPLQPRAVHRCGLRPDRTHCLLAGAAPRRHRPAGQ